MVESRTNKLEAPGWNLTGKSEICRSVFKQDLSDPQPHTGENQHIHVEESCCQDMSELEQLLKSSPHHPDF